MQRATVSFIVTSCALPWLCPSASAQPTEGVEFEATKNLVVMIEGKLGEVPTQGAGIVFANQGGFVYIATAFHVVRRGENIATDFKIRFAGVEFHLNRPPHTAAMKKGGEVYANGYPRGRIWDRYPSTDRRSCG